MGAAIQIHIGRRRVMRKWLLVGLGLLVAAGLGTGMAAGAGPAQEPVDPAVDKTSAVVDLQAGFVLDPYLLPVVGNGTRAASSMASACTGHIDEGPDVTVNWSGSTAPLSFFVYSDDDPVLVVELPDGSVLCNDDAGLETVQPLVEIARPAAGTYRVYVGSAEQDSPALGALGITRARLDAATLAELDLTSMLRRRIHRTPPAQFDPNQLPNVPAAAGRGATLKPGFGAVRVLAMGGGDIAAVQTEDSALKCAGFANPIASYRFAWSGHGRPLRLFFEAQGDSALFVATPDRKLVCGMGTEASPSPTVDIRGAADGEYKVYVASMQPDKLVAGRLTITEDMDAEPQPAAGQ
jgi:hypothetical protein